MLKSLFIKSSDILTNSWLYVRTIARETLELLLEACLIVKDITLLPVLLLCEMYRLDRFLVLGSWSFLIGMAFYMQSWLIGVFAIVYIPILLLMGAFWYLNLNRKLLPYTVLIFLVSAVMLVLAAVY